MNFNEFKEYISYYDYPKNEEYTLEYGWIHPEYIPKKLKTLGIYSNVYKFKNYYTNYNYLFSKEPLSKPINVPITCFKEDLFNNNTIITDIVLNKYIKYLPQGAFKNCINLKRIYLNKNINFIPKDCFKGCNNLEIYYEGSMEEFNKIRVIYKEHKAIFKPGLYDDVIEYIIPGNEAFVNANVHFNCKLEDEDVSICFAIEPILKIKNIDC